MGQAEFTPVVVEPLGGHVRNDTLGSSKLSVLCTSRELASLLSCSFTYAEYLRKGIKTPSEAHREVIAARYGVKPIEFDQSPSLAVRVGSSSKEKSGKSKNSGSQTLEEVEDLLAQLKAARDGASIAALSKIASTETKLLDLASWLRGERTIDITEQKILKSPAFRSILETIAQTLEPWPDAMAAVGAKLKEIA